jgi:uncharacterized protein YbbC (DUF1343 family)/CubicO group peptidase (beta-lactamase class C family)
MSHVDRSRRRFLRTVGAGASLLALGCRTPGATARPGEPRRPTDGKGNAMKPEIPGLLDRELRQAIQADNVPGAVALVDRRGEEIFCEAFGHAALTPRKRAMRIGHVFDLASLTKVVATTPAILALAADGQGALDLDDPVAAHLPAWNAPEKKEITIRHCLTHVSGLPGFQAYYRELSGKEAYLEALRREPLQAAPGARRVYSDLGFMLLGLLVESVAKEPLDEYVQRVIFAPLGMSRTGFNPLEQEGASEADFAATEMCPWRKKMMVGEVHDENAYAMGGVAGHAGLFSTARDLGRFGRMLVQKGEFDGCQILSPESVSLLNTPQVPEIDAQAGLAWQIASRGESPTGFLASPRSFGHTGFTGTSLWIDPDNRVVAVLLTNAIHPSREDADRKGVRLGFHRGVVRTVAPPTDGKVRSGLDVLQSENFRQLRGKRVAVVSNHTAINAKGEPLLALLGEQPEIKVAMLFGPEHGFAGKASAGEKVGDSALGGVPVYSLYGERRKPAPETAERFDVMLFDIQDVGARFYTYIWTLFRVQQFCAETGKPLVVLDRPNPIGGRLTEGPVLDEAFVSSAGPKPLPIRHGLTVGELAGLYNARGWLGPGLQADLEIIRMTGWRRDMAFIDTGLPWIAPSPNMRTWDTATVYPGACLFEGVRWSEGRGTNNPFEIVGGPGVDSEGLARELNDLGLPGCRFLPVDFTPKHPKNSAERPKHEGQRCGGVFVRVDDGKTFRSVRAALAVLIALRDHYPNLHRWREKSFDYLAGSASVREQIEKGVALEKIEQSWSKGLEEFEALRESAMLY